MHIRLLDAAFLLQCSEKAARSPKVGHLDADHTTAEIRGVLNKEVFIPDSVIESCIAYFRELGREAEHPDKLSPDELARKLCNSNKKYDPVYGVYVTKRKTNYGR